MSLRPATTLHFSHTFHPLTLTLPALAQVTVKGILDPRKIAEGGQATFSIEVVGGSAESLPQRIQADGLNIDFMGHNSSLQIVNGQRTERFSYVYAVRPTAGVGLYAIPAVIVRVSGQRFETEPQELLVQKASDTAGTLSTKSPAFLQLELPKNDIYVGEVVPLKLTLYVLGRGTISGVGQPDIGRENLVMKRFPTSPVAGVTDIDGRLYSTLTLETSVFAITEGTVTIGPCELPAMYYEAQEYSSAATIFRHAVRKNFQSNSVQLNIKPLPTQGKPPDFTGAVGAFTLTHEASPTELEAGDPISVDLHISGIGNFDSLEAPALTNSDGWQLYPPRELVQNLSDGVVAGKVTYSQVIIPLREHSLIQPFRFSFFDPTQKKYVTLETPAVPITVRPDPVKAALATTSETPGNPGAATGPLAVIPTEAFEDILFIRPGLPVFQSSATPLDRLPAFWAAQSLPALTVAGLLVFGLCRRWNQWGAARRSPPPRRAPAARSSRRWHPARSPAANSTARPSPASIPGEHGVPTATPGFPPI